MTDDVPLTPLEAGKVLGGDTDPVPPALLSKWRRDGSGPPFVKIGKRVRYTRAALVAWRDGQTRRSTAHAG